MRTRDKTTRILFCGLAGVSLWLDAGAQDRRSPPPALGSFAPVLSMPAAGAQVPAHSSVTFRWAPPLSSAQAAGAPPPPHHHLLCVAEEGAPCSGPNAVLRQFARETASSLQLPPQLRDKRLEWTVAACWASEEGATKGADTCTWADARSLVAGNAATFGGGPPPRLVSPNNPASPIRMSQERPSPVTFTWTAPISMRESAAGGARPTRYLLCVTEQGGSCLSADALLQNMGTGTAYNALLPVRFYGKTLTWTVAACGPDYGAARSAAQSASSNADCTWAEPVILPTATQSPLGAGEGR